MNGQWTEQIIHLMGGIKLRMGGTCKTVDIHDLNHCVKFCWDRIQFKFITYSGQLFPRGSIDNTPIIKFTRSETNLQQPHSFDAIPIEMSKYTVWNKCKDEVNLA